MKCLFCALYVFIMYTCTYIHIDSDTYDMIVNMYMYTHI